MKKKDARWVDNDFFKVTPPKRKKSASRMLAGEVNTAEIREETFQGRTHLVIPVVALVEGVLHAVNSEGPELVLASEFSQTPEGWNGRPVMMDHPADGAVRVSANSPKVLEATGLGTVFNARIENGKLLMEAWIDQARVSQVDGAADVVARLKKPELVDVSVGVFVAVEKKAGTYNGTDYTAIWRGIVPDHLAVLPAGTPGACSVEMGCGLPRAAAGFEEDAHPRDDHGRFGPGGNGGSKDQKLPADKVLDATPSNVALLKSKSTVEIHGNSFKVEETNGTMVAGHFSHDDHGSEQSFFKISKITQYHEGSDDSREPNKVTTRYKLHVKEADEEDFRGAAAQKETKMTWKEKFAALLEAFKPAQAAEMSDTDVRTALDHALFNAVPGFIGIDAVFDDRVVYAVAPPVTGNGMMAPFDSIPKFQRSYTVDDTTGEVTLGVDAVEVHQMTSYEPVGTPPPAPVAAAGCGCTGGKSAARGEKMPRPKVAAGGRSARIQAVLDRINAVAPGLVGDKAGEMLNEWTDAEIEALDALAGQLEKTPETPPADPTAATPPADANTNQPAAAAAPVAVLAAKEKTMNEEEFLAAAPEPYRTILKEHKAAAAAKHEQLVGQLKTAQSVYGEDELKAMSASELEKVAKLVAASKPKMDFSGQAPAGTPDRSQDEKVPAPIDINKRVRAARGMNES